MQAALASVNCHLQIGQFLNFVKFSIVGTDSVKALASCVQSHTIRLSQNHRCKKRFYVFLFWSRFYVFNVFLFSKRFLFLKNVGKVQSGKQINKKHFQNNSNEIQWVHK